MENDAEVVSSSEDVLKLFETVQTAIDATISSSHSLLNKVEKHDPTLSFDNGLSLLNLRPHILLSSLHHLVILLALRLTGFCPATNPSLSSSLTTPFANPRSRPQITQDIALTEIAGELIMNQEVMEKVRGLESKLEYQIKKLVGLAEAEEKRGKEIVENAEEDPLSFRPNLSAIVSRNEPKAIVEKYVAASDGGEDNEEQKSGVYRPPRVAAMPYNESSVTRRERERRAPALLGEFAATMDNTPLLESTTGLSVRPVMSASVKHSNSVSAKRAAELKRIQDFEEENMTRLVTSKREAKRRREDEEALAMGFGVGPSRGRRGRNGLEAELEGVLGERGDKGVWDNVGGKFGQRGDALERGRKRISTSGLGSGKPKKAKFERELKRRK
ncbi:uncharacterized protein L203_101128 [Cryptococcus depauperatus CBS 7841]|uniref:Uncharacterized protein n=1 Tax=Cryptococcus depauperatus CBS 7841 TaxID=1295531 RepID=A0A1E3IK64_9TREE|nr:U3 small nucleolar ribonucleoprotein LCP5 [Cryptococcus depauperatus CBS 7841]